MAAFLWPTHRGQTPRPSHHLPHTKTGAEAERRPQHRGAGHIGRHAIGWDRFRCGHTRARARNGKGKRPSPARQPHFARRRHSTPPRSPYTHTHTHTHTPPRSPSTVPPTTPAVKAKGSRPSPTADRPLYTCP
eukprot:scaffold8264_cov109-Isochrysis_galbana.AAC.14